MIMEEFLVFDQFIQVEKPFGHYVILNPKLESPWPLAGASMLLPQLRILQYYYS